MKRLLLLMLMPTLALASETFWTEDVWKTDDRGFLFYGPLVTEPKEKPIPLESIQTVEALHAERDRRLHLAIMTPSEENIAAYQEVNTFMLEKSALFADMWRRSLWSHPQYDFTAQYPTANFAQVALKDERTTLRRDEIQALTADWGLIVVVNAECRFCDLMAPIAQKLTDVFGFEILAINVSSTPSASWPEALPDNGTIALLTDRTGEPVTTTPTVFLVNRDRQRFARVATGVVSFEELIHRIHTLATRTPGQSLFGKQAF